MDSVMVWLPVGFCFFLVLFLTSGVIIVYLLRPSARMQRAVLHQARLDYQDARGTAHLRLLHRGRANLRARIGVLAKEENDNQKILKTLEAQEQEELRLTLERYIVQHYLDIPGIGQKLRSDLVHIASQGRLDDLKYAHQRIYGIGEARQASINFWVQRWEERIPGMLQEDFPGKNEIAKDYAARRKNVLDRLSRLAAEKEPLEEILNLASVEIQRLEQVKPRHFQQILLTPGAVSTEVDHFIQGVFAEWEPMPAWFKEMLALENS